jgi:hypothetical protein
MRNPLLIIRPAYKDTYMLLLKSYASTWQVAILYVRAHMRTYTTHLQGTILEEKTEVRRSNVIARQTIF